jgi:hypothetical protein
MNDQKRFGPLDTIETLLSEALRIAALGEYSFSAAKISEALDAVLQDKRKPS